MLGFLRDRIMLLFFDFGLKIDFEPFDSLFDDVDATGVGGALFIRGVVRGVHLDGVLIWGSDGRARFFLGEGGDV